MWNIASGVALMYFVLHTRHTWHQKAVSSLCNNTLPLHVVDKQPGYFHSKLLLFHAVVVFLLLGKGIVQMAGHQPYFSQRWSERNCTAMRVALSRLALRGLPERPMDTYQFLLSGCSLLLCNEWYVQKNLAFISSTKSHLWALQFSCPNTKMLSWFVRR